MRCLISHIYKNDIHENIAAADDHHQNYDDGVVVFFFTLFFYKNYFKNSLLLKIFSSSTENFLWCELLNASRRTAPTLQNL